MTTRHALSRTLRLGALAAMAGCSSGGDDAPAIGFLSLGLTDSPVESAESVVVAFSGLEIKPADGPPETVALDPDACDTFENDLCYIDLLTLQGTTQRTVFAGELSPGELEWIRLLVAAELNVMDSYITFEDQSMCSLYVPSGAERGLQVNGPVTVTANGRSEYTIDWDLRSSVTMPPGQTNDDPAAACAQNYFLRPTLRLVDSTTVGSIGGTVDGTLLADGGCGEDPVAMRYDTAAVYAFEDPDGTATPDDVDDNAADGPSPVATAGVEWDETAQAYRYEIGFLLPGDYLLALTCNADVEDPTVDDTAGDPATVEFIGERTTTVETDAEADGDFPTPGTS
jgi:hypothetical protein